MLNRKRKSYAIIAGFIAAILIIGAGIVYSHYGGFSTGKCADTGEFLKYAESVSDFHVPDGTRIVALGEASHGNKEYQQLRLDIFRILVDQYGVRAFALEGDCGGCELVNRYIHGDKGNVEDALSSIGFAIYRTEEMKIWWNGCGFIMLPLSQAKIFSSTALTCSSTTAVIIAC
jgi:erythromycin esterase